MSAARSELLQGTPVPQRGPAVLLTASTSQREIYGDAAPLVEAAKWEHRETTQAARRCLQVAHETAAVGQATLDSLFVQGEQLEAAAHGVEQIDGNVRHAGRILKFMSRCCCCRNSWNDGDLEIEWHYKRDVERRRGQEQGVLQDAAALTAMKRQVMDEAAFKGSGGGGAAAAHAGSVARSSAASSAAAAAAAGSGDEHGDGLIPAVPGARREDAPSAPGLGYGLAEPDRRALQAETAAQEVYFSAVDEAVDTLRTLGLAMGTEMDEQNVKVEALQAQTDDVGRGIQGISKSAAKLAGAALRRTAAKGSSSAAGWQADHAAARAAVTRAAVSSAPTAIRYGSAVLQ